ncbi:MAG: tRNA threonylcarbamoyladenosine dehydratase [Porphyromonas sp.]|nr:tRNA threonylcarbamoyladenosine dehydratase [Porphyromonas sp.]
MQAEIFGMRDPETFVRTELLLGREKMQRLRGSYVMVIGLGGVGGYVVEMLARSGVGRLTIVDPDVVQPSNLNRQLIATQDNIGESKASLWRERLRSINPELKVDAMVLFVRDELTDELLQEKEPDFVIDAIDTLSPKVHLIKSLQEHEIPFISVMGTGAMVDPTQIKIGRMDKMKNCPLGRMIRKRLRKLQVPLKFPVVYSEELPLEHAILLTEGEQNKKSTTGTIAYNPAVAGCYAAYFAIDQIVNRELPHEA